MNRYQPSTPRTAFGVIAFALTFVTFGLSSWHPPRSSPRPTPRSTDAVADAVTVRTVDARLAMQARAFPPDIAFRSRRPPPDERLPKGRAHAARPFAYYQGRDA